MKIWELVLFATRFVYLVHTWDINYLKEVNFVGRVPHLDHLSFLSRANIFKLFNQLYLVPKNATGLK